MGTRRSSKTWLFVILAVIVLFLLFGIPPPSRESSLSYSDRFKAHWGLGNGLENSDEHENEAASEDIDFDSEESASEEFNQEQEEEHADESGDDAGQEEEHNDEHGNNEEQEEEHRDEANGDDVREQVDEKTPADSEEEISIVEVLNTYLTGDIEYRLPQFNNQASKHMRPRNYKGPGHPAFALFYATRNATDQNSYFIATQQIVYRLLWDPHIRSLHYPVVVFVPPFVTQSQRDYFTAAGAMVRELAEIPYHAINTAYHLDHRFRDVMSKILMWNETDFSRLAFLDSDAFPWVNIDHIMNDETAPTQTCRSSQLSDDDRHLIDPASAPCDYVFAAHTEDGPDHFINAGVMVLKPDARICERLVELSHEQDRYNNLFPEQGPLTLFYRPDGAFPSTRLSESWNSESAALRQPGKDVYVVHEKIWTAHWSPQRWIMEDFNATWETMLTWYESSRFAEFREEDDGARDEEPVNEGRPVKPKPYVPDPVD